MACVTNIKCCEVKTDELELIWLLTAEFKGPVSFQSSLYHCILTRICVNSSGMRKKIVFAPLLRKRELKHTGLKNQPSVMSRRADFSPLPDVNTFCVYL